jgi:hypothetical protein
MSLFEQHAYSHRYIRFVKYHLEEFTTIYLAPTPASSRALQERLSREYATLIAGHICTCWCSLLRERQTGNVCGECQRRRHLAVKQDVAIEIGRGALIHAPCPLVLLLDLHSGYAA